MNAKQTAPLIAAIAPAIAAFAPVVIIGVPIFLILKCLLSDEEKKKKQDVPANTEAASRPKEAEIPREIPVFRGISPEIPVKPAIPTAHKIISQVFAADVKTYPKCEVQPAPPIKKSGILRDDMAKVFHRGPLTRQAAVAALKQLGFGQTAAYAALLPDGRFSTWLHFTPDGTITWKG